MKKLLITMVLFWSTVCLAGPPPSPPQPGVTVDDSPANGATTNAASSNWAYDHGAAADPHAGYMLESNIGTGASNYNSAVYSDANCTTVAANKICLKPDGTLYAYDGSETHFIGGPNTIDAAADPDADRGAFWDESAGSGGAWGLWTPGTYLAFSTTTFDLTTTAASKLNEYHQTANVLAQDVYANAAGVLVLDPKTTRAITISEIYIAMDADPTAELTFTCYQKTAGVGYAGPTTIGSGDTAAGTLAVNSGFTDATVPAGSKIWCVIGDDPDDTSTVELSVTGSFD